MQVATVHIYKHFKEKKKRDLKKLIAISKLIELIQEIKQ